MTNDPHSPEPIACCAHMYIRSRKEESRPGTVIREWWECRDCLLEFKPNLPMYQSHPPDPTARTPDCMKCGKYPAAAPYALCEKCQCEAIFKGINEPLTHELKCWPAFFLAVQRWDKMFEIRRNDRSFKVGDVLWLREWNGENYTGESVKRTISYITDFPSGLRDGYVCMGLAYPDLPAMAQRVLELKETLGYAQESFDTAQVMHRAERDKMAARVDELHDSLSLAKRQRDDVAAQVDEQAKRSFNDLARQESLHLQRCIAMQNENDELRKALAEAKELIRQADADPHIAYSPEWRAKATKFVLVGGRDD